MFQRFRCALARFMQGRHGYDQLTRFMLWAALAFYALGIFPPIWFLGYVGLAILILALLRVFSKNVSQRVLENAKYLQLSAKIRTGIPQARARFKNRREYKYFRCPKCRSWLKLKRGAGEGTLTCGNCKHSFKVKA
ncbi:MAG: hypothetical protein GX647_00865 [Clostridiales bacterium]|jgi:hypothetical protein|nr:hypothetical protein [Clostridiales bacterium]